MTSPELKLKQLPSWQQELGQLMTDPAELVHHLKLGRQWLAPAIAAAKLFPLRATRSYVQRIAPGRPDDPLLRQILPLQAELKTDKGYSADPLGEQRANPVPGLIHKYHGRVLLVAAPQCAINCRYCFRRHFDYKSNTPSRQQWQQAIDYIRQHPSIDEVILSGGDPLVLADKPLAWLVEQLASIQHVQRLRIHSRLPIVLPQRLTAQLLSLLQHNRMHCVVVVHCNHPKEINDEVASALLSLKHHGLTTLNQSVLLKGVNDCSSTLVDLSKRLFELGVLPYYLHALDKIVGAAHFEVAEPEIKNLYRSLLRELPGYLVPKLVREVQGAQSKVAISCD
ncbi:MAG: EF-P beta-lysylation protein EpmB [Cellvibrionaceae bacterium]|nr:EF-P beta-lysylation protein EpmB [Cellvibrionaceae bacterium]